ncbi:hypothetical protein diail_7356 [Diaporthe ilicicola]|nr:hypothetical protein diail_7356 [Diaporthe ilicicola]
MANEQSDISLGDEATYIVDGVATLSVTSPNAAFENQNDKPADSALSQASAQEMKSPALTSPVQSPPSPPLWNTREGRIAGYKRMIEKKHRPQQRANFEALIRYYENGGKVPEGDEELWAVDGQTSFGIRKYTQVDQMPEGWLYKQKYLDSSKFYQFHYVPKPDEYRIGDAEGRVIL